MKPIPMLPFPWMCGVEMGSDSSCFHMRYGMVWIFTSGHQRWALILILLQYIISPPKKKLIYFGNYMPEVFKMWTWLQYSKKGREETWGFWNLRVDDFMPKPLKVETLHGKLVQGEMTLQFSLRKNFKQISP